MCFSALRYLLGNLMYKMRMCILAGIHCSVITVQNFHHNFIAKIPYFGKYNLTFLHSLGKIEIRKTGFITEKLCEKKFTFDSFQLISTHFSLLGNQLERTKGKLFYNTF